MKIPTDEIKSFANVLDADENLIVTCSECNQPWFSPFDRLFTLVAEKCFDCSFAEKENETDILAKNILKELNRRMGGSMDIPERRRKK